MPGSLIIEALFVTPMSDLPDFTAASEIRSRKCSLPAIPDTIQGGGMDWPPLLNMNTKTRKHGLNRIDEEKS
jgi:hypothetical protein